MHNRAHVFAQPVSHVAILLADLAAFEDLVTAIIALAEIPLVLRGSRFAKPLFSDKGERSDHCNEETTGLLPSKIALVPNAPSRIAAVQP